ncbi:MAG: DNA-binding response regulator [Verrucomicrobia bacterium]|nr:MAG: DNA-binding response regulator [Verrucomicrobiota bacterium]
MSRPIRVAIVEDDPQLRSTFCAVIEGTPGLERVVAAASAEEALRVFPGLTLDVILCDLSLPRMQGDELVAQLRQLGVKAEVIVVSVHDDPDSIFKALRAGANGYLVKPVSPVELVEAIKQVHAKGAPMSGPIARRVIEAFRTGPGAKGRADLAMLTPRETEVLELLAQGFRYKEIAAKLGVSVPTVTTHLHRIYDKLHVTSATAAVGKYFGH